MYSLLLGFSSTQLLFGLLVGENNSHPLLVRSISYLRHILPFFYSITLGVPELK
jgi:uncharacterized protein YacL